MFSHVHNEEVMRISCKQPNKFIGRSEGDENQDVTKVQTFILFKRDATKKAPRKKKNNNNNKNQTSQN